MAVNDQPADVSVRLEADGSTTAIRLSPTDRPVEVLRQAASVLERYAASNEREHDSIECGTCGATPTGIRARPDGLWVLIPCGHGLPATG